MTLSDLLLLFILFPTYLCCLCTSSNQRKNIIVCILSHWRLLAVVKLPQLLLLQLWNLHVHESRAGAAGAFVARHRVPDNAFCYYGLLHLVPVFIFLYSNTIHFNVPLRSAVACTASAYL